MQFEDISLEKAERLTGLPSALIEALADSGEIPSQHGGTELLIGKAGLLGWCRLFGRILTAVTARHPNAAVGGGVSARNLVWLAQAGLLTGRDRIRI